MDDEDCELGEDKTAEKLVVTFMKNVSAMLINTEAETMVRCSTCSNFCR